MVTSSIILKIQGFYLYIFGLPKVLYWMLFPVKVHTKVDVEPKFHSAAIDPNFMLVTPLGQILFKTIHIQIIFEMD